MAVMLTLSCFFSLVALSAAKEEAVVLVVDPAWDDTAGYVEHVPLLSKFKVIKAMMRRGKSHSFVPGHFTPYRQLTYQSESPNPEGAAQQFCPELKSLNIPIAAIIPTSDPAVALADLLAECAGVRGNPASGPLAKARRNKWIMAEAVRNAGLRTMKQKVVSSWTEAESYLGTWEPALSARNPCVFKILQGSGGEGTVKVTSMQQARSIFDSIVGSVSATADVNTEILIQEYLVGKEYAVDTVSRDGVHKVLAVWFEDFREANGVFDQYFGFKLLNPEDELTKKIVKYGLSILDATGLRNGAANTEIKYLESEDAPCLMEINARWAGISWGDGLTVEEECVGKDQIEATFEAFLDKDAFDRMPDIRPLKQHGAVIFGMNFQAGILRGIPGLEVVQKMPSYSANDINSAGGLRSMLGKVLPLTTPENIPICIALAHNDEAVVDADYASIIRIEKGNAFFDIAPTRLGGSLAANPLGHVQRRSPALVAYVLAGIIGLGMMAVVAAVSYKPQPRDTSVYVSIE